MHLQLNANHHARINVKLVSEVGTVVRLPLEVAKAKADVILVIRLRRRWTGASPRSSIQHAGAPWELGVAGTNQNFTPQRFALTRH